MPVAATQPEIPLSSAAMDDFADLERREVLRDDQFELPCGVVEQSDLEVVERQFLMDARDDPVLEHSKTIRNGQIGDDLPIQIANGQAGRSQSRVDLSAAASR